MSLRAVVTVLAAAVLACDRHPPVPSRASVAPPTASDACQSDSAPKVSTDSIGVLDLRQSLAQLKRRCPSAASTVLYGEESANDAIAFTFGAVSAVAWQAITPDSALMLDSAADFWRVTGGRAKLARGLTLASPMRDLRAAFGAGVAQVRVTATVEFCALANVQFDFPVSDGAPRNGSTTDLSIVPDTAVPTFVDLIRPTGYSFCVRPPAP